ncbi:UNVERIFIED_CONTAM: hypothetical protein Slati_1590300 [Sesamum latifolium]|uniref:Uncharacterized protein n=1 Tax=Sesamum latifolium TaxID=2727402 RepID=A0AAW2X932_9LAMI
MDVSESPLSTSPSPPSSFSTRDELDAVCSNVCNLSSYISISSLYSDLSEADRARVLEDFRQATVRWNMLGREKTDEEAGKEVQQKSHVLVVTDACLPVIGSLELPVSARILINYELPTKKVLFFEAWLSRSSCT